MMKRLWMLTACLAMFPAALSAQTPPEGTRGPGARRAPTYNTVEGQPIESRKPNNPNEVSAFPGQTRAPYHRTALQRNSAARQYAGALQPRISAGQEYPSGPEAARRNAYSRQGGQSLRAGEGPFGVDHGQGFRSPRPRPRS